MHLKLITLGSVLLGACVAASPAMADTSERLQAAAESLGELRTIPEKGIPTDLMKKAECIIVVPSLKKAALGVGGEYGRGFASCRREGGWTAPAGVRVTGGNFGFQIGGSETEVVMLVMNRKGMEKLLSNKFTLGGDASVAAGPVGRATSAKTDAAMTAEILSWSRSRGVFAGVALSGATVTTDDSANKDMYGKELSNREILSGSVKPPAVASAFLAALNRS
jgi:lipid-binding SYLF domain-containing protein